MQDETDPVSRLRNPMSRQNLRDVPVRRNIGSGSASHTVTESYEHHQSDFQGVGEPKDAGRSSERAREKAGGCTQGVLWWERIALYDEIVYILHQSMA